MAIIGIGIDVVDVARWSESMARTPDFGARVLTPRELKRSPNSQAARFAVKEALAKALGAPGGLAWHDAEVITADSGRPEILMRGSVESRAIALGVRTTHVSISHDGGIATAIVILES